MKPEITSIKLLGYDKDGKEYNLSDCISDDCDSYLSQDIETWRKEN
jgi:hypothetical protein